MLDQFFIEYMFMPSYKNVCVHKNDQNCFRWKNALKSQFHVYYKPNANIFKWKQFSIRV